MPKFVRPEPGSCRTGPFRSSTYCRGQAALRPILLPRWHPPSGGTISRMRDGLRAAERVKSKLSSTTGKQKGEQFNKSSNIVCVAGLKLQFPQLLKRSPR